MSSKTVGDEGNSVPAAATTGTEDNGETITSAASAAVSITQTQSEGPPPLSPLYRTIHARININFQAYLEARELYYYDIHSMASHYYMRAANLISALKLSNNVENECIILASYLSVIFDIGINNDGDFQEHIFKNVNDAYAKKIKQMLNFITTKNEEDHNNITNEQIPFYIYNLDKINDGLIIEHIKANNYNVECVREYLGNYTFLKKYPDFFKFAYKLKDHDNLYLYQMNSINNIVQMCETRFGNSYD